MAQATLLDGVEYDTSLALRAKVLSLYSLDTNTDAVSWCRQSSTRICYACQARMSHFACPPFRQGEDIVALSKIASFRWAIVFRLYL